MFDWLKNKNNQKKKIKDREMTFLIKINY